MRQLIFQVTTKLLMGLFMLCISISSYAQSSVVIPTACNTCGGGSSTPCTAPTALVCEAAATISAGGTATSTVTGGTGGTITWAISPTAGVSTTSGSGSTTGAITFTTAGTYTVTFNSTNNSSPAACSPAASVTCTRSITVNAAAPAGSITALNCASATHTGTLTSGTTASGVSSSVPYTGGNGGAYSAFSIASTGITGLTASIAAGTFATGAGNLTVTISGTPSGTGAAYFALTLGGQSCTLSRVVVAAGIATICPMDMGGGVIKNWLCHNLGADNTLDPHIPSVGIQGSYIKWGKTYNMSSTINDGVAGFAAAPTASNPNAGVISGWDMTEAPDNAWNAGTEAAPIKTATDPCPSGYRVPTMTEFTNLVNNTIQTMEGTRSNSATNYGTIMHFGTASNPKQLSFPISGTRIETGALDGRGSDVPYPSSSIMNSSGSFCKVLPVPGISTTSFWFKFVGYPVRCIAQ